jgi:hypothetical protein
MAIKKLNEVAKFVDDAQRKAVEAKEAKKKKGLPEVDPAKPGADDASKKMPVPPKAKRG